MNKKNIIIAIVVIGIGIILYKFLLSIVLPVVLFVSLGKVLKFLLKDSEADSEKKVSSIFSDKDDSSSIENVVEIKPIKDEKPVEDEKPVGKKNAE